MARNAKMPLAEADDEPQIPRDQWVLIGRRLKAIRELSGHTQVRVTNLITVDQPRWSRWEAGERPPPLGPMLTFSARYRVSLDFIYRGLPGETHPQLLWLIRELYPDLLRASPMDTPPDKDTALNAYRAAIPSKSASEPET